MPDFNYVYSGNKILGTLPNGDEEVFDSVSDYEDACCDMYFDLLNDFETDGPEDWVA